MVIGAVVCLLVAALMSGTGLWTLVRRPATDLTGEVLRLIAPVQLAGGVMLAAAGLVALAGPPRLALAALVVGITGALVTVAAGSWQGARYAARRQARTSCGSQGGCGTCSQGCR